MSALDVLSGKKSVPVPNKKGKVKKITIVDLGKKK